MGAALAESLGRQRFRRRVVTLRKDTTVMEIIKKSDVRAGDVLLCRGKTDGVLLGPYIRREIASATGSPYTHAAIATSKVEIADARVTQGVTIRPLDDLVKESTLVAVFRTHPGLWTTQTLDELRDFAAALHALNAGYNHRPFWKWVPMPAAKRREAWAAKQSDHLASLTDELTRYFEGELVTPPSSYRRYFCSEFVVACFIHCGLIQPSAAIVFRPDVHSPGDLAQDSIFGFFVGYLLAADQSTELLDDDPFLSATRYRDIYP